MPKDETPGLRKDMGEAPSIPRTVQRAVDTRDAELDL